MVRKFTRRTFVQMTAAGSALALSGPRVWSAPRSANEQLNIAFVGVGNKGWDNVQQLAAENVVALCDVDENMLGKAAAEFPQAKKFADFRVMLDQIHNEIDAVVVSTPDHLHAPATLAALDLSKHVYCEKPLAHTVLEARAAARLAARNRCVTQMGTQIHAGDNYRRVVEIVRSGVLGPVERVYTWCNKAWSDGRFQSVEAGAPANLNWDLWLGPAAERPYSEGLHPAGWRRFWEYGTGTFGDMACHVMDLPFWALELGSPKSVGCEGPEVHEVGTPAWVKATYQFDVGGRDVVLHWSDGGAHFDEIKSLTDAEGKSLSEWGLGICFIGPQGSLVADYGRWQLLPTDHFADYQPPEPSLPRSIGHWREWAEACKNGQVTTCNFDYSGGLTEAVLLGTVAYRAGETLHWDAKQLKVTNSERGQQLLTKSYRDGWAPLSDEAWLSLAPITNPLRQSAGRIAQPSAARS